MRWATFLTGIIALALAQQVCLPQTPGDLTTQVDPRPEEEILQPCQYDLALPESREPVRAVWVIFDRGLDYTAFYRSRQIRAFAGARELAMVLALHCRSKEREDMNVDPAKGIGRALFTALDQFADSAARPELRSVPLVAMGWSGAGSLVGRLAGFHPERFRAGILYAPGQYEPLGMDTIELGAEAIQKPQLIIAGGADDHVGTEGPYRYFKKYFDRGAPWTFAIQNRTPHCCLQNAQNLILEWLNDVLATASARMRSGQFGYLTAQETNIADQWKHHTFNATAARVSAEACQPRQKELCAGWLPSRVFAESWLQFVRRPQPLATWAP
jgi:dienelactone hydrolase